MLNFSVTKINGFSIKKYNSADSVDEKTDDSESGNIDIHWKVSKWQFENESEKEVKCSGWSMPSSRRSSISEETFDNFAIDFEV